MSDEEKQEEQYAAITAIGLVERELARLTHAGGDSTAIEQLIITKAQLSKDAFRLGGEVAGSKMSKNLIYFLDEADKRRVNEADRILAALGELQRGQSALQAGFRALDKAMKRLEQRVGVIEHELNTRYEESKSDRANLHAGMLQMRADLDALKQRMDHIEQRINDEAR